MIVHSHTDDPYQNQEIEASLLAGVLNEPVLFTYQNRRAVVIGKNQNPWMECGLKTVQAQGMQFLRRISGGGTVVNDVGNLNWSLILPRKNFSPTVAADFILAVLHSIGLAAEFRKPSSIAIKGKKVSGLAYCLKPDKALLHGTLLVAADLNLIRDILNFDPPELITHAVRSIPARMGNLSEFQPGITLQTVVKALDHEYRYRFEQQAAIVKKKCGNGAIDRWKSWDWLWGQSPAFCAICRLPVESPSSSLNINVRHGKIVDIHVEAVFNPVLSRLKGIGLQSIALAEVIQDWIHSSNTLQAHVAKWMLKYGFTRQEIL